LNQNSIYYQNDQNFSNLDFNQNNLRNFQQNQYGYDTQTGQMNYPSLNTNKIQNRGSVIESGNRIDPGLSISKKDPLEDLFG